MTAMEYATHKAEERYSADATPAKGQKVQLWEWIDPHPNVWRAIFDATCGD